MRIVFVSSGITRIPPQEGGGVEVYIYNLAQKIATMGHDVIIVDRKYEKKEEDIEIINGIKIVRLNTVKINRFSFNINLLLSQIIFGRKLNSWLKNEIFDVTYVCFTILGLTLSVFNKKMRNKVVYSSHSLRRERATYNLLDRLALFLENQVIKKAKLTIIANEVTAKKIIRQARVDVARIRIVPVGVDTEQYNSNYDITKIVKKYSLDNKNIVLFIGRICADKGVEYLIKAADIVVNQYGKDNVRFLIVGPSEQFTKPNAKSGSYTDRIKQLVNDYVLNENVIFTGTVQLDDKIKLYSVCDMVVIPSVVDLDPQVQIEAMASGKPVIGTRIGTMPRRIKDGLSGFIVNPADEKQLADKIKFLLENPAERIKMGACARQIVVEKYSAEHMALRMLEVFKGIG